MSHPQPVNPNSERDPADTTPLDAACWQPLLVGNPDRDFASYVSRGLKFGFCSRRLEIILAACTYLGIPVAEEKTEASTTSLTFLGIHLNTDLLEARLTDSKLTELRDLLVIFSGLPSCTQRDLLSLLGKLNFATSVVVAGRTFMRRLWDATLAVPELHYRITLSQSCRADLAW